MPRALHHEGQRLPASYANFYIANGLVLLPTYDPERDEEAKATLARLFPGRDVVGIDCTDLVWGLGAFHCVTQQWPSLKSREATDPHPGFRLTLSPGPHQRRAPAAAGVHAHPGDVQLVLGAADDVAGVRGLTGC